MGQYILHISNYRGQHRKGKQNIIPKKGTEGNSNGVKIIIFFKYQKYLVVREKDKF
jgi:hypothetical protein